LEQFVDIALLYRNIMISCLNTDICIVAKNITVHQCIGVSLQPKSRRCQKLSYIALKEVNVDYKQNHLDKERSLQIFMQRAPHKYLVSSEYTSTVECFFLLKHTREPKAQVQDNSWSFR